MRVRSARADGGRTDLEQVHDHVPLAAITDQLVSEVLDQTVVNGQFCVLDGELEVVVGLVQLVPEEDVRLAREIGKKLARFVW